MKQLAYLLDLAGILITASKFSGNDYAFDEIAFANDYMSLLILVMSFVFHFTLMSFVSKLPVGIGKYLEYAAIPLFIGGMVFLQMSVGVIK